MMIKPAMTDLMKIIDSRYSLVLATAKRAREIEEEDKLLPKCPTEKSVSRAAEEIFDGRVIVTEMGKTKENGDIRESYAEIKEERRIAYEAEEALRTDAIIPPTKLEGLTDDELESVLGEMN